MPRMGWLCLRQLRAVVALVVALVGISQPVQAQEVCVRKAELLSVGLEYVSKMQTGDWNYDGIDDVVITSKGQPLLLLSPGPTGSLTHWNFVPAIIPGGYYEPRDRGMHCLDFDQDGDVDCFSTYSANSVGLFRNENWEPGAILQLDGEATTASGPLDVARSGPDMLDILIGDQSSTSSLSFVRTPVAAPITSSMIFLTLSFASECSPCSVSDVSLADLNDDNLADFVWIARDGNFYRLFASLNLPTGVSPVEQLIGNYPSMSIAICNIDERNPYPEIVAGGDTNLHIVYWASSLMSVLTPVTSVVNDISTVYCFDWNNDGHDDVIYSRSDESTPSIGVHLGNGTHVAPDPLELAVPGPEQDSVKLTRVDFDGDGDDDIIGIKRNDVSMFAWIRDANGVVEQTIVPRNLMNRRVGPIVLADTRHRGVDDIVAAQREEASSSESVVGVMQYPDIADRLYEWQRDDISDLKVKDLNGDGLLDILACGHPNSRLEITSVFGTSTPGQTFGATASTAIINGFDNSFGCDVGSLDSDAAPELVIALSSAMTVFQGSASLSLLEFDAVAVATDSPISSDVSNVVIQDANGDGIQDLLFQMRSELRLVFGSPALATAASMFDAAVAVISEATGGARNPVWTHDFDANGVLDIVHVSENEHPTDVSVLLLTPTGSVLSRVEIPNIDSGGYDAAVVADLNGDGLHDLLLARDGVQDDASLVFVLGQTGGSFGEPQRIARSPFGFDHAFLSQIGDVDGDGQLEFLLSDADAAGNGAMLYFLGGIDADGDGYTACTGDCAEGNPAINPGVLLDLCDGIDNNCDGLADEHCVVFILGILGVVLVLAAAAAAAVVAIRRSRKSAGSGGDAASTPFSAATTASSSYSTAKSSSSAPNSTDRVDKPAVIAPSKHRGPSRQRSRSANAPRPPPRRARTVSNHSAVTYTTIPVSDFGVSNRRSSLDSSATAQTLVSVKSEQAPHFG